MNVSRYWPDSCGWGGRWGWGPVCWAAWRWSCVTLLHIYTGQQNYDLQCHNTLHFTLARKLCGIQEQSTRQCTVGGGWRVTMHIVWAHFTIRNHHASQPALFSLCPATDPNLHLVWSPPTTTQLFPHSEPHTRFHNTIYIVSQYICMCNTLLKELSTKFCKDPLNKVFHEWLALSFQQGKCPAISEYCKNFRKIRWQFDQLSVSVM